MFHVEQFTFSYKFSLDFIKILIYNIYIELNKPMEIIMNTTIFYRIALTDNIESGLFSTGLAVNDRPVLQPDPIKNPLPSRDKKMGDEWLSLENPKDYLFGFSSIEQLFTWVDRDMVEKHENKKLSLYIIEISSDDMIEGETQLAYHKHAMLDYEKYPLKKLLDLV